MRAAALLVPALLAACAGTANAPAGGPAGGRAEPRAAILYADTVNVLMSDRSLCVGERPGRAPVWGGTLQGCPHAWRYAVARPARGPREVLPPVEGAAALTLTRPDGAEARFGPR